VGRNIDSERRMHRNNAPSTDSAEAFSLLEGGNGGGKWCQGVGEMVSGTISLSREKR
jgi:hypothetical protein